MRVLVITPWLPTKKKPASGIFTLRDIELLQTDHDVTVVHLVSPQDVSVDELDVPGLDLIRQPYSFTSARSVWRSAKAIKQQSQNYDVVHSMAMSALLPVALSRPQVPWIHTEHFSELVNPGLSSARKFLLSVLKNFYRLPAEVVAVGRQLAEKIDRYRNRPTWVIGNFVRFPRLPTGDTGDRDPERIKILSVGGLISRKGPLEVVDTVKRLRDQGYETSLTWIGSGELEDQVRQLVVRESLEDHVTLTGHVEPASMAKYFHDADVFVLPTEAETFGVVFAEALATGLPIVTSGIGGHLDFLPARASRVVTKRSGTDLASAVLDLLADDKRMTPEEIREYATQLFSEETRRAAYHDVYEHAIKTTSGPLV